MPLSAALRPACLSLLLALGAASGAPAGQPAAAPRPAPDTGFDGLWCGTGLLRDFSLELSQRRQDVQGTLVRRERRRALEGRIEGGTLHTQATRHGSLVLERAGDELRVADGEGPLALVRGASFQRASGASCSG